MNKATRALLSAPEVELVLATEKAQLDGLDEDQLCELHDRVRRARNKYSKLHRRQASAQVTADAARGAASTKNQRTAQKAEVFEDALSRVSRRLAAEARRSSDALRAERLAAARGAGSGAPKPSRARTTAGAPKGPSGPARGVSTGRGGDGALRSPSRERTTASTRAAGKRTQARRDSR